MLAMRVVVKLFAVGLMATGMGAAWGQNYPTRPIRMVTAGPGASMDLVARVTAQGLAPSLGQSVIVDNRAGAGGRIAADIVAKASPDGYTLLTYTMAIMILPFLAKNVPFDPVKDLSPITLATSSPNVLVVHPSVRANSVKELIALAKAKPGALNYSSAGTGSGMHLSTELFKSMAGIDIVHVPYKTTGPALNDLIGGQLQMSIPSVSTAMPHVKSGKLKGLAVTSAQPSTLAPGLPTVAASGLPGYESELIVGLWAPAGTPETLINRLNREIVQVLNQPDVKQKFFTGAKVIGSSPEQFALAIRSERTKLGKVIKDAGIREE